MPVHQSNSFFEKRKRSLKAQNQDRVFVAVLMMIVLLILCGAGGLMLFRWLGDSKQPFSDYIRSLSIWQTMGLGEVPEVPQIAPIPLANVPVVPQIWHRRVIPPPKSICLIMKNHGFKTDGWQRTRGGWDGWECLGEMEVKQQGETVASMFFSMRGYDEKRIDTFRFKFNLPPEKRGRKAYARLFVNASIAPLFEFLHWSFPSPVREKIAELVPFEMVMDGVSVRLFEEFRSNQRVNLLLRMPKQTLPYEIDGGQVRTRFVAFKKEGPRKITQLKLGPLPTNKIETTPIDLRSLDMNENGVLLPREALSSDPLDVLVPEGVDEETNLVEVEKIEAGPGAQN